MNSAKTAGIEGEDIGSRLPLTEMRYTGNVHGVISEMQLELRYQNLLDKSVESVFTFPLLPETSVSEVEIVIGENRVQSELRDRESARQRYNQARDEGHHAALLEEETPNIFTMSVGGIEPGQEVFARIKYLNRVDWQNGGGRLTIPLVVAPHFSGASQVAMPRPLNPPIAANPSSISYKASVLVSLRPGFDADVSSPSHDFSFGSQRCTRDDSLVIDLDNISTDRDLIFTYQSTERLPVASLTIEERRTAVNVDDKFYLVQLSPPSLEYNQQLEREVVLCLDTSGSMEGLALDGLKRAVGKIITRLAADGGKVSLGIITFNDRQNLLTPLRELIDVNSLLLSIDRIEASGGTRAGAALDSALELFDARSERPVERSIIFITDGDTTEYEYDNSRHQNVRIHGVGISSAVDHHVLKAVCEKTGGSTYWVHPGEDYDAVAREVVSRTSGPIVTNLRIDGINPAAQVIGGSELWSGAAQTLVFRDSAPIPKSLSVCGTCHDGTPFKQTIECAEHDKPLIPVSMVWARQQLRGDLPQAIAIQLSLEYGVLSRWTSFVAVQEKAVPGAIPVRVDIPVHMPYGWEMEAGFHLGLSSKTASMFTLSASSASDEDSLEDLGLDTAIGDAHEPVWLIDDLGSPVTSSESMLPQLIVEVQSLLREIRQTSNGGDSSNKWKQIRETLLDESNTGFLGWTESQKAELYLALSQAKGYGYSTPIPREISQRPIHDNEAKSLWIKAQRALGIHVNP
jgi:Ca-activated chloride channel family protein